MDNQKENILRQCISHCIENNNVKTSTQRVLEYIKEELEDQRMKNDKLVEFANELKKVGYYDFDYIEKVVNTYNKKITQWKKK
tara:strand:+ start:106 stop:354 length:249 start_codon:yes stop_codon:yes gene_type:complete